MRLSHARSQLEAEGKQAGAAARKARMSGLLNSTFDTIRKVDGDSEWTCPQCGHVVRIRYLYEFELHPCPCGLAAEQQAYQEFTQSHHAEAVDSCWGGSRVPRRFCDRTFENFARRPGTEAALTACKAFVQGFELGQTSTGLLFSGTYGSGKTHLAVATARALVERDLLGLHFAGTGAMLTQLKASDFDWDDVQRATNAELLILDDLAQDAISVYDRRVLFDLLNDRYEQMRPTMFTTNAGEKEMVELLGGAFVSRLYEMAMLVEINASDYRRGSG